MNGLAYAVHHLFIAFEATAPSLTPLEQAILTDLQALLLQPHTELESIFTAEANPEWLVLPSAPGAETSPAQ